MKLKKKESDQYQFAAVNVADLLKNANKANTQTSYNIVGCTKIKRLQDSDMLKKIGRWIRYIFEYTTLDDLQEDIDCKRIDFNKYLVTVPSGASLYRLVKKGDDPIAPTGIGEGYPGNRNGHRWVSTPLGFSFELYRDMYYRNDPQLITCGTGAVAGSLSIVTPFREVGDTQNMDLYKLTLKKDIQVVDLELICKALRIPTPLSKERHPVYHKFYGTHIRGVKFRSFRAPYVSPSAPAEDNVIIYTDWFKDFKDSVDVKKIKNEPFSRINPDGNSLSQTS